ncbi:MAG: efflux RND transporter periplasmic adaptor subunit, partial [Spirochaetales bacterium]|nr:efflux RND transporter periplasmic adaptor subunit [Spirochaetales bacterium]
MRKTVRVIKISTAVMLLLLASSCQKEDTTALKDLEQIYSEQGIPVKVRTLEEQNFSSYLSFTSSLKGIKESTGSSLVSDTVEEVLVSVGDYVEKDQPLVRFPRTNPSANYYQSLASFESAEKAYRRIESLYNSNGVSRQNYDDARTQYEVQKANWQMVQDMIEVKAPISGYITRMAVKESDNVSPGEPLFTISNYDRLRTVVWVADHEIVSLREGQRAIAEWEDVSLQGTVTQVDLSMDSSRKAFAVYISFDNTSHAVPSGVTGDIHIETKLVPDAIVLNRTEMLKDGNGWYVYVDEDGRAVRKNIQTGIRQGMYYQVTGGLS